MADVLTIDQRRKCMSRVKSKDTKPETMLRKSLWNNGLRYRVNDKKLPGKPDIVLPKYRTVIFVHGCFWHGHKGCKYYTVPKTNTDFWTAKVARNRERDQEEWRQLEAKGWYVIIVWECELKKALLDKTIARVKAEILRNGDGLHQTKEDRQKAREEYRREMKSRKERVAALKAELLQK